MLAHKLLHFTLIMVLMIAPLRGAMAMQVAHCNMASTSHFSTSQQGIQLESNYAQYRQAQQLKKADVNRISSMNTSHQCCSGNDNCVSNCAISLSATLLMQVSLFLPNYSNILKSVALVKQPISKEFTPPFRPPLVALR